MALDRQNRTDPGSREEPAQGMGEGPATTREKAPQAVLRGSRKADLVAVLGLGRGEHIKAARANNPEALILVWEPLAEAAANFKAEDGELIGDGVRVSGAELVNSLAEMKSKIAQGLIYGPSRARCELVIAPGYEELVPHEAENLKQALRSLELRKKTNLKTVRHYSSVFLSNFKDNFQKTLLAPEATAAMGRLDGVPGLIVAAGPSLENDLAAVRELAGRAALICVGTVFRRLVEEGISPDAVVMIEPRDRSAQVSGFDELGSTLLALSSVGHPSHLAQRSAQNLVFHPQPWLSRLVGDWVHVPDGGNVGSAAFTLGVVWGCNPIIMVGQDLSYGLGQRYAQGTGHESSPDQGAMTRLPGNKEEFVQASPEFVSYLSWYEESALFLNQARPDLSLINSTSGGARIEGFSQIGLKEALGTRPILDSRPRDILRAALAGFDRQPELIRERLAELRHEAFGLAGYIGDSNVSLAQAEETVLAGPLGSFLAHLLDRAPGYGPGNRIRKELIRELNGIGEFAADLQRTARELIR